MNSKYAMRQHYSADEGPVFSNITPEIMHLAKKVLETHEI
jgi:hypothetical protein